MLFQHVSTCFNGAANPCRCLRFDLTKSIVLCLIGNSSPHKPQAFGQIVERNSLAQLIPKWYVILTLGWIQNIKHAFLQHSMWCFLIFFLMFGKWNICNDDAPIEDGGSASGQRFSELDSMFSPRWGPLWARTKVDTFFQADFQIFPFVHHGKSTLTGESIGNIYI